MSSPNLPATRSGAAMTPAIPQATRTGQGTAVEQSRAVAEVEAAIVVAMRHPRDTAQAEIEMGRSCSRKQLAEQAFFRFPRAGQQITGESIHLARELARCWGNLQYGIVELRRDDEYGQSEMLAFAWDVQTNTRSQTTFIVPHLRDTRGGAQRLTDVRDIYENNANMGARRVREMIFAVLPGWFTETAVEACHKTLAGNDDGTLPERIDRAVKGFAQMGITPAQLQTRLGAPRSQWQPTDLAQLTIIFRSIQRGEVRKEDEFPAGAAPISGDEIISQPKTTAAAGDGNAEAGDKPQGQKRRQGRSQTEPPAPDPDDPGPGNSLEGAMGAALRDHARSQEQGQAPAGGGDLFDAEGHVDPADPGISGRSRHLKRGGALKRKTELRRSGPIRSAGRSHVPAATTVSAPPPRTRKTNAPTQKTRGLVLGRDNWQCVACGKPVGGAYTWWSLQHRKARGQGGGNEPSNLIVLCGSATSTGCHRTAEDRDAEAHRRGYWVASWQDPATTPVYLAETGRWVLLADDGKYIDTDDPQEAA